MDEDAKNLLEHLQQLSDGVKAAVRAALNAQIEVQSSRLRTAALLEILVQKGILTQADIAEISAEADRRLNEATAISREGQNIN